MMPLYCYVVYDDEKQGFIIKFESTPNGKFEIIVEASQFKSLVDYFNKVWTSYEYWHRKEN